MQKTRVIIVGGFLGAGKTSLLWRAAQQLSGAGRRAGLITNDQAPELVDTTLLVQGGSEVAEVSGSCFCCNFQGFVDALSKLRRETKADVIIAEPVGSCTDLSATIVQPLKAIMKQDFLISPLSVLIDPVKLDGILNASDIGLHPSAFYILQKQLEEADIIGISKADLLTSSERHNLKRKVQERYPGKTVMELSAKTGKGFDIWLEAVTTRTDAGNYIASVDYDVYAEGEAVLGWLNASIALEGEPTQWKDYSERLLSELSRQFTRLAAPVGHVKLMLTADNTFVVGNLTGKRDTLSVRGPEITSSSAQLTLNARVQISPETLNLMTSEAIEKTGQGRLSWTSLAWQCFSPGRPAPTHRYDCLVQ